MKERFFLILLIAFSLLTSAVGRQQPPAPAPQTPPTKGTKQQQKNPDEVVRISVTLVLVDVAATDKKGRTITDLKPDELEIYEDGRRQQMFTGRVNAFDPGQQKDLTRIVAGGSLLLGNDLQPGDYALQLIVTDKLAKEESRVVGQWIDFEIVK